jgi:hypothetical protein
MRSELRNVSAKPGEPTATSYLISYELHDQLREPALLAALEVFEDRCKAKNGASDV